MDETSRILLVEDDTSLANLISHALEREGMNVSTAESSVDAILCLQKDRYEVVLLDIMLKGTSGLYVIDAVRDIRSYERPKIVIITGARSSLLSNIDRSLVKAVLFKPLDVPALTAYVKAVATSIIASPD